MADFRTFQSAQRQPCTALAPVIDPAGWSPEELSDPAAYSYRLKAAEADDLLAAVAEVRRRGVDLVAIKKADFPLPVLGAVLADMRRELADGRGFVLLRGFPVGDLDREGQAIAYLGLGAHLGNAIQQNAQGHVLGHVKDLGGDINDLHTRTYVTCAAIPFHNDNADYVGLLCLQTGKQGGESRIASSVTIYNRILASRPDLAEALCGEFAWTRHGETNPGEPAWHMQRVFNFAEGYFTARAAGLYVRKTQGLPGVPPFTPAQEECLEYYPAVATECAIGMVFEPGDIQLLNNHVIVHSRSAFTDWPEPERMRHLLRLWINDPTARPLPDYLKKGRARTGVRIDGVKPNVPLDVEVPA